MFSIQKANMPKVKEGILQFAFHTNGNQNKLHVLFAEFSLPLWWKPRKITSENGVAFGWLALQVGYAKIRSYPEHTFVGSL